MRHTLGLAAAAAGLALAATSVLVAAPQAGAAAATPPVCGPGGGSGDFNGDGYADLAIGVRGENGDTGAVDLAYGGPSGLVPTGSNQHWSLDSAGVNGVGQAGAGYGWAVSAGDFNGDGYDDLAIGAPLTDVGAATDAGQVSVMSGSSAGVTATGDQLFTQDTAGVADSAETGDEFGHALSTGDFNADGYDDLAIGVPGENASAGAVEILLGSPTGLTTASDRLWSQDSTDMDSAEAPGDLFGWSLATGRFNNDQYTDLAVGVPHHDGAASDEGAVHTIYGSSTGPSATTVADQLWTQGSTGVPGDPESGDAVGWSVAAGDFNGDDYCDLAAGVPNESVIASTGTAMDAAGAVLVLHGAAAGLSTTGVPPQLWTRDTTGVADEDRAYAQFGWSLAAGDINGDGYGDLAIGAPSDEVSGKFHAGSVSVMYGYALAIGLSATAGVPDQVWNQDVANVESVAGIGEQFGYSLTMGDFNGGFGQQLDLAIGVPGENSNAGGVAVLYEWNNKLETDPTGYADVLLTRNGTVFGTAQPGDRFGENVS